MNILIAYGTNSGGTQEAAEIIEDTFARSGHSVQLVRADRVDPQLFKNFDLIILGSCTWELKTPAHRFEGSLQEHMIQLRDKLKNKTYPGKKFAVFGLGDSSYTSFCIAANHLVALVNQIKGTHVGETLKLDKFFFHLDENRRKVRSWVNHLTKLISSPNI